MVKLHPDTSGYDSAEDFSNTRRFYDVFKDKVQPEKIWDLYVQFGDDFNIYSDEEIMSEEKHHSYTISCCIESLLNLLMVVLISFYYFNESAKRGFFTKVSLAFAGVMYLSLEIILIFNIQLDETSDKKIYICNILRSLLLMPQSTNQELRYLVQVLFCAFIVSLYTFTTMFFPPSLEIMFDNFYGLNEIYVMIGYKYETLANKFKN